MRWLVPLAVLAAAGWWVGRLTSAVPPDRLEGPPGVSWAVFDCDGERRFAARFGPGGAELYFPDGRRAAAEQDRYAYAGGEIVLDPDGRRASFAKGGARVDCRTRTAGLEIEVAPGRAPEPLAEPLAEALGEPATEASPAVAAAT